VATGGLDAPAVAALYGAKTGSRYLAKQAGRRVGQEVVHGMEKELIDAAAKRGSRTIADNVVHAESNVTKRSVPDAVPHYLSPRGPSATALRGYEQAAARRKALADEYLARVKAQAEARSKSPWTTPSPGKETVVPGHKVDVLPKTDLSPELLPKNKVKVDTKLKTSDELSPSSKPSYGPYGEPEGSFKPSTKASPETKTKKDVLKKSAPLLPLPLPMGSPTKPGTPTGPPVTGGPGTPSPTPRTEPDIPNISMSNGMNVGKAPIMLAKEF
jgi:hypothetical protein